MSLQVPFNSENAEYIKQGIRARINQSSVTLVMATDDTHQSEWVNWEIEESLRQEKGVLAMYSGDKPPSNLPDVIQKNNIKVVPWNHETLMKEIERAAKKRGA